MENAHLQNLLQKQQEGSLTAQEQKLLDEWYDAYDVTRQDLVVFKDQAHEDAVKQRLKNRIMESGFPQRRNNIKRLLIGLTAAASLFLLLYKKPAMTTSNIALQKITLPDGSTVTLNKGSEISYHKQFSDTTREIFLTGEAFFDVQQDAKRPFYVHTGDIVTKVLGTSFNVKANGKKIEITVVTGKVAVSDKQKTLAVLLPDQKINYQESIIKKEDANAHETVLWKEEDLKFENMDLKEILPLLETRYGVKIETKNIDDYRFTAYFLNTSNITQVLNVITKLNNLNWKKTGTNTYQISK
jgi:ferric-dicitrate binding protein FerR (iron transport regulator)